MQRLQSRTSLFLADESGAVTVDWVVLTASLVGLGLASMAVVSAGVEDLSGDVNTQLASQEISTSFGVDWEVLQWEQHNPGIYDSYAESAAGMADDQLLDYMAGYEQYADYPAGSGHPYDTYHDEYYIARDEAITRGLIGAPS